MRKTLVIILAATALLGALLYVYRDALMERAFRPTESAVETVAPTSDAKVPEIIAEGLEIPWELAFLPDGDMLVTERPGRLLRVGADGREVIEVSGVAHRGEGGLLGIALHPRFRENGQIYLYLTTSAGGKLSNRVERYVLDGTTLSDRTAIIEGIPGASYHDGGRIAFGPDGMLYIATGDAGDEASAQDTESLAGKILRVRDDGTVPSDNPFGSAVYSYGHRNVQGLAWDGEGQLFATEHGRSGLKSGFDELNLIVAGGNYGWPDVEGDAVAEGMRGPVLHSGASDTWAPSGAAYVEGQIVFAGLRGRALYLADVSGAEPALRSYLKGEYGRLRTVVLGPDGMLYVLTNNRDGRGDPSPTDDRIIRIDPRSLGI